MFEKKSENTDEKNLRSYHKSQRRIHSEKGEDIPIIKSKKRESTRICEGLVEKGIH